MKQSQNLRFGEENGVVQISRRRIPTLRLILLALVPVFAMTWVNDIRAEKWTDSTGKFTVEAEFLKVANGNVYLKKTNGVTIAVPLDRLNAETKALAAKMAAATPAVADDDSPDAAVRRVMEGMESGNLRVVWDSLPVSYQQDVHDVVHGFATNMDAQLWNSGADILKKVVAILKQKKDFILNYPALAAAPVNADTVAANWDTVVDLLDTVVNSELTDLDALKTIDIGDFADGTGAKVMQKLTVVAKAMENDGLSADQAFPGVEVPNFNDAKISTINIDGDTATVRVESDDKVEEHAAVRVEGKWLPKEMVDGWPSGIASAKQWINGPMKTEIAAGKQDVIGMLGLVNLTLGGLLAAKTQEEFNSAVDGIMQMLGPAMGGGPGGAPGGGPGGADPFGAPPAGGGNDPFGAPPGGGGNDPFGAPPAGGGNSF